MYAKQLPEPATPHAQKRRPPVPPKPAHYKGLPRHEVAQPEASGSRDADLSALRRVKYGGPVAQGPLGPVLLELPRPTIGGASSPEAAEDDLLAAARDVPDALRLSMDVTGMDVTGRDVTRRDVTRRDVTRRDVTRRDVTRRAEKPRRRHKFIKPPRLLHFRRRRRRSVCENEAETRGEGE